LVRAIDHFREVSQATAATGQTQSEITNAQNLLGNIVMLAQ
jgi:hypothetical protein